MFPVNKIQSIAEKLKPSNHSKIIGLVFAVLFMVYMIYRCLSIRIGATGWEHFPSTLLDWGAIIGSAGFCALIIIILRGLFQLFQERSKAKNGD